MSGTFTRVPKHSGGLTPESLVRKVEDLQILEWNEQPFPPHSITQIDEYITHSMAARTELGRLFLVSGNKELSFPFYHYVRTIVGQADDVAIADLYSYLSGSTQEIPGLFKDKDITDELGRVTKEDSGSIRAMSSLTVNTESPLWINASHQVDISKKEGHPRKLMVQEVSTFSIDTKNYSVEEVLAGAVAGIRMQAEMFDLFREYALSEESIYKILGHVKVKERLGAMTEIMREIVQNGRLNTMDLKGTLESKGHSFYIHNYVDMLNEIGIIDKTDRIEHIYTPYKKFQNWYEAVLPRIDDIQSGKAQVVYMYPTTLINESTGNIERVHSTVSYYEFIEDVYREGRTFTFAEISNRFGKDQAESILNTLKNINLVSEVKGQYSVNKEPILLAASADTSSDTDDALGFLLRPDEMGEFSYWEEVNIRAARILQAEGKITTSRLLALIDETAIEKGYEYSDDIYYEGSTFILSRLKISNPDDAMTCVLTFPDEQAAKFAERFVASIDKARRTFRRFTETEKGMARLREMFDGELLDIFDSTLLNQVRRSLIKSAGEVLAQGYWKKGKQ